MLLYNVTVGVDKDIEQEWLTWMKQKHMPDMMKTGMFVSSKIFKVLHDQEDGTISYSVQYIAPTLDHIQKYLEVYAPALSEEHRQRYLNKHVAFRTLLEEV
jgi:hypothetical protein